MIIRIILNNFFKNYYMNKKLIHLITTKLPIVTLLILILSYAYLSIPNNYAIQVGGMTVANTFSLPKNVPWKYKYRYLLLAIPIMLIVYIIIGINFRSKIIAINTWKNGQEFFSQFYNTVIDAVTAGDVTGGESATFYYEELKDKETSTPEIAKLFNFIQLTGNPFGNLYKESQYFCNTYRPCSCCDLPGYQKFFKTNKCPNKL